MAEQRTHLRVAVHYPLVIRHGSSEGRGVTENLSERGAMVSVDIDPPLTPGDRITLDLDLPGHGRIRMPASVRWASSVLPGMTGIEFIPPVAPELLAHLAQMSAESLPDRL